MRPASLGHIPWKHLPGPHCQFFGIREGGTLAAVAGIEMLPPVGLLRSLAVAPAYRGRGMARLMVAHMESFAARHGVESLFLLTTTAESFFLRLGYEPVQRDSAPPAIRGTRQFSELCPGSSAFLAKHLTAERVPE